MLTQELDKLENTIERINLYTKTYRLAKQLADEECMNELDKLIDKAIDNLRLDWINTKDIPF